MAGCFGDDPEDKWKEKISMDNFEFESEPEIRSCDWCHKEYEIENSEAREPELYCSPVCRSQHYTWSEQ